MHIIFCVSTVVPGSNQLIKNTECIKGPSLLQKKCCVLLKALFAYKMFYLNLVQVIMSAGAIKVSATIRSLGSTGDR